MDDLGYVPIEGLSTEAIAERLKAVALSLLQGSELLNRNCKRVVGVRISLVLQDTTPWLDRVNAIREENGLPPLG